MFTSLKRIKIIPVKSITTHEAMNFQPEKVVSTTPNKLIVLSVIKTRPTLITINTKVNNDKIIIFFIDG